MSTTGFCYDENVGNNLPTGTNTPQQAGVTNINSGGVRPEVGAGLPWVSDPSLSWLDYDCSLVIDLDAGQALHKILPQGYTTADSLGAVDVSQPTQMLTSKAGTNLASNSAGVDVIQQMATSTYTFKLRGYGVRAGYRVTIPKLVTVGGVPATPAERQHTDERIIGNMMGVPIFMAAWDLWYYVALPPNRTQTPPANLAEYITGDVALPTAMQVPVGGPDQNSIAGGRVLTTGAIPTASKQ